MWCAIDADRENYPRCSNKDKVEQHCISWDRYVKDRGRTPRPRESDVLPGGPFYSYQSYKDRLIADIEAMDPSPPDTNSGALTIYKEDAHGAISRDRDVILALAKKDCHAMVVAPLWDLATDAEIVSHSLMTSAKCLKYTKVTKRTKPDSDYIRRGHRLGVDVDTERWIEGSSDSDSPFCFSSPSLTVNAASATDFGPEYYRKTVPKDTGCVHSKLLKNALWVESAVVDMEKEIIPDFLHHCGKMGVWDRKMHETGPHSWFPANESMRYKAALEAVRRNGLAIEHLPLRMIWPNMANTFWKPRGDLIVKAAIMENPEAKGIVDRRFREAEEAEEEKRRQTREREEKARKEEARRRTESKRRESERQWQQSEQRRREEQQGQDAYRSGQVVASPYQVLGIATTATEKQTKARYRKLAIKYHPDKNNSKVAGENRSGLTEAASQDMFKKVQNAFQEITDARGWT
jgi:DnaJ-domain-containing protein 1